MVVLLVQAAAEVTVAFNGERFPLWAIALRNPAFVFNAHAREDFKQRDDKTWLKHTVAWKDANWKVTFDYRPVRLNTLSNEVESFPPAVRTH